MRRILSAIIIILCLSAVSGPLWLSVRGATLSPEEINLYEQINEERAKGGLNRLHINDLLTKVAQEHSFEMLKYGYFDHVSQVDGSAPHDRVERIGYYDGYYGMQVVLENIGLTRPGVNVDAIMKAWMNSRDHAENILNIYVNEVGVGIVLGVYNGREDTALYTVVFAYRADAHNDERVLTVTTSSTETSPSITINSSTTYSMDTVTQSKSTTIFTSTRTYHSMATTGEDPVTLSSTSSYEESTSHHSSTFKTTNNVSYTTSTENVKPIQYYEGAIPGFPPLSILIGWLTFMAFTSLLKRKRRNNMASSK